MHLHIFKNLIFEIHTDPLHELLGDFGNEQSLSADFSSGLLHSYTGPISSTLKECIESSDFSANEGIVYAEMDKVELQKMLQDRENGTFSRREIRESLLPVFGYAMRNSQINWDWKGDNQGANSEDVYLYEFYMTPSEEALWNCYLSQKTESEFFERLFATTSYKTKSISLDSDGDGIPDSVGSRIYFSKCFA